MAIDNAAATAANSALGAIPFASLIGGPLEACIQAQAKAAKTSWDFIQNVGLQTDPETGEQKAIHVTFQYNKNGELVSLVVPLLAIVPIPYLSINKVDINFMANISASASTFSQESSNEDIEVEASAGGRIGWGPFSVGFNAKANYSSKKSSSATKNSKYSVEYTMNVGVKGRQADMPAGMATILNILSGSVTDAKAGGDLRLSPPFSNLRGVANEKVYLEATLKDGSGLLLPNTEVNFNLRNVPPGLNLKNMQAARGELQQGATSTNATISTDKSGVAGLIVEIESVGRDYDAGAMMILESSHPNIGTESSRIRSAARVLPPPPDILQAEFPIIYLVKGQEEPQPITLTLKDNEGNPIEGSQIEAVIRSSLFAFVSPTSETTSATGEAVFNVTPIGNAPAGRTSIDFKSSTGVTINIPVTIVDEKVPIIQLDSSQLNIGKDADKVETKVWFFYANTKQVTLTLDPDTLLDPSEAQFTLGSDSEEKQLTFTRKQDVKDGGTVKVNIKIDGTEIEKSLNIVVERQD